MAIIGILKTVPIRVMALAFLLASGMIHAQDSEPNGTETSSMSRGSVPATLLRPHKGEAPRYPVDTIIGPLGQGGAPGEAYQFARQVAAALLAGNVDAPGLAAMNRTALESQLSALGAIRPRTYRIGGGREEADGAVSFMVRFVGREQGISGELYVRFAEQRAVAPPAETPQTEGQTASAEPDAPDEAPPPPAVRPPARRVWIFEDLILDEARSRDSENDEAKQRFDFPPYERFF
jgi:hypothetical protein